MAQHDPRGGATRGGFSVGATGGASRSSRSIKPQLLARTPSRAHDAAHASTTLSGVSRHGVGVNFVATTAGLRASEPGGCPASAVRIASASERAHSPNPPRFSSASRAAAQASG